MSPAIMPGDRVVVHFDSSGPLRRGDLVALSFKNSSTPLLKRIAAVPGDIVTFHDKAVWVNGKRVREIYPRRWRSTIRQLEYFGNKLPEGNYLILGDNPLNSRDSGRLGLISEDHMKGKVLKVTRKNDRTDLTRRILYLTRYIYSLSVLTIQ